MNKKLFSVNYLKISIYFIAVTIFSLSIHAVMLQILKIPYPSEQTNSLLPEIINNIFMMYGIIWLEKSFRENCFKLSVITRGGIIFFLLLCINEIFRGWFMNSFCANPNLKNWLFFAILLIPKFILFASATLFSVITNSYFQRRWVHLLAAFIFGLFISFTMPPLTSWFNSAIIGNLKNLAPTGSWCQLPYGIKILIPAYLTFIEPALAVLCCIIFVRKSLASHTLLSSLVFMLLIMALKSQLVFPFLYAIYAQETFFKALLSIGQFTIEIMFLSFFMALSLDYAKNNR